MQQTNTLRWNRRKRVNTMSKSIVKYDSMKLSLNVMQQYYSVQIQNLSCAENITATKTSAEFMCAIYAERNL